MTYSRFDYSRHVRQRMAERHIQRDEVECAIRQSDDMKKTPSGKLKFCKKMGDRTLTVVCARLGNSQKLEVVTCYWEGEE